jgi:PsbP
MVQGRMLARRKVFCGGESLSGLNCVSVVLAGKFYTLVTGANEKRWDKVKDTLETVVKSFTVVNKY